MSRDSYTNLVDMGLLRSSRLPDPLLRTRPSKVTQLLYANSGKDLVALASNAVRKVWMWPHSVHNPTGECSAAIMPHMRLSATFGQVTDEGSVTRRCISLSDNGSYILSASGGQLILSNTKAHETIATLSTLSSAATCIAYLPQDNNIIAIGMEDSTIKIYNVRTREVESSFKGHEKPITGIAFSQNLNILVSAGEDSQLCVWDIDGWVKRETKPIQAPPGSQSPLVGETKIQFHNDQTHLLVVHASQFSVYDSQLECLKSWYPRRLLSAPISSATFSCDGRLIFTGFCDGAVGVFDAASFRLQCRIGPSAYLSSPITSSGAVFFPVVIAAHPSRSNQMALGMSNGSVHIIEPLDEDSEWETVALGSALPRPRHTPYSAAPAA